MKELSALTRDERLAKFARAAPPFIGRKSQLDLLDHCLQETLTGHPRLVLVQGEAGVGKTRLLKEVRAIALHYNIRVCQGRCYEDLALPYWPFVESLFAQLQQIPEEMQHSLGTDMEIISQFLHRGSTIAPITSPSLSTQADQDTSRLFLALSHATIKLAQGHPLLLAVDDLQWADRPSLDLFSHLVFAVADTILREPMPLLIVGAYRPVEAEDRLARAIARFQREELCQTLELSGLNEGEVDELIQGLGVTRPSHQLVETVSEATRGNPLFVQEVLHHLVQRDALKVSGGYVVTTVASADLQLPAQVTIAIVARIQGLSEDCRRTLTLASFLGDHFSLQILNAVSGVGEDKLLDLLEEGIRQRLLLNEGDMFQFAHPLIQHVCYSEPSVARRQRIHRQIAQTLERLYASSLDEHLLEIAHHLVSAGPVAEVEKVVEYARRAGDQAFAVFAWGEAARYYEAALAAGSSVERFSAHERAEFHHRAGLAYYRNMDVGPCLDHYEKAIAAYRLTGDVRGLAQTVMEKTRVHFTLASVPYGSLVDVQPLENVLEALGDQEPGLRGHIWAIIARAYWTARQPDKAEEVARRALAIGQRIRDDYLCAEASVGLALVQMQNLYVHEALESLQHSLLCARRVDDILLQGFPLQRMPLALSWLGRLDEAEAVALEACELIRQTHDWGGYSAALATLVSVAVARGDFDMAERHAYEAMTMVRRSHYPWGGALVLPALVGARVLRGAWAEAEDAIDILVEPGRVFAEPGPAIQLGAWLYRQFVRAHSGMLDGVKEQFAVNPLSAMGKVGPDIGALAGFCALVEIGDLSAAPTLAEQPYQALSLAVERGVIFSGGLVFLLPRVLGVAATLQQWWDKAEAHFQAAIETAAKVGARPELGRSYLDYARMLAARNKGSDRSRASQMVEQASAIFNELAMEPFARRAAQLAETLQARIPIALRQPTTYSGKLSGREVEVLRQIARSRTDQEIADGLVLSPKTVMRYVNAIFDKTGVNERSEMAAYAAEKGFTSPLVILFTDIVGSTVTLERLGDAKAQELLRTHNTIIRDCLREHSGCEIKHTGDGIMASFTSPSSAIECTIAIQKAFAKHNRQYPDTPIRVRIGLNAGEPIVEEGQLYGAAVNAASRICNHAQPDQILVSEVVRQLVAGKGFAFADRGRFVLKGFSERFRLYAVQWEDEPA